jgi:signal transduction histidine kinase
MTIPLRHEPDRVHDALMRARGAGVRWLLAATGPVLLVCAGLADLASGTPTASWTEFVQNIYPNIVFGCALPLLGALILSRLPRHPIGWLYLGCGLASAATLPVYSYARLALYDHPGEWPLGVPAAWVSAWLWTLGFMPLVTLGVLLFPDGKPPSPPWRLLIATDVLGVLLAASAVAFSPGPLTNHHIATNPLGVPLPHGVFAALGATGGGLFLFGLAGAGAGMVVRWRRAVRAERAQLNWFALAVLLVALGLALPAIGNVVMLLAIPLLPVAVAVAILRRNLYGIELVVRRSLVYGTLTAVLLVGYGVVVTLLGAVVQDRTSPAATLVGTALVAIAFAPLRERLQRAADRLLYGDRASPYTVLTHVGRRLDDGAGVGNDALAEIAETVATSLRLPYVRVDVSTNDKPDDTMAAEWGAPVPALHEVTLKFHGEPVGTLRAARRTPHEPFGSADLRLLDDLGRQVGVAAHAMLLGRDLQRSREELVSAREEERRRIRRDLHDGLGPALAGVALGLDAIGHLAATRAEDAGLLAEQLKQEVHASLVEVRRLVEDLRPPALDQLGLVGALRQQAARLTERDVALKVAVEGDDMHGLPAAVEVAAYRITTEALNNVSRHAAAQHCQVGISMNTTGELVVSIEDDGAGMPATPRQGVGTSAMRERAVELGGTIETTPVPTGGTLVTARIPVATP